MLTGIFKQPVTRPVHIGQLGLESDVVADTASHGGLDQAVYVYGSEDYDWWSFHYRRMLEPGTFGENLTIDSLESEGVAVGDRLTIGETVILEVTAPRIPCNKLGRRMEDAKFVERFRDVGRPGFYCRVIAEGDVHAGDAVFRRNFAGDRVTVVELFHDHYAPLHPEAVLRRYLAAPLSERLRNEKLQQLQGLMALS